MKTNHRNHHEDDERMVHNPKGEKEKYSDIFEFRPGDDKLLRPLQIVYFKSPVISKKAAVATNNEDSEDNTGQPAPELEPAIEACTIVSTQDPQPAIEACTIVSAQDPQPATEACTIVAGQDLQPANEAGTIAPAQDLQPANEAGTIAPAKITQPAIMNNYIDQELQPAIEAESTEQMLEHQPAMKADADDHSLNSQSVISSIMMIEPEADKFLEPPVVSPFDLENDIITSDKAQTRRLYVKYFPNDKANNARSYNFMVNKLQKKGLKIANLAS
ncbi:MAG: hypothetical protein K2X81_27950 [Candidatus Obscuribacterales bacterium]|nr:hypothetical protein [Candidatus Obscuribacterales bacterium]